MPEHVQQLIVQVGMVAGLIFTGWQASRAKHRADRAAKNTGQLSNGFTEHLHERLDEAASTAHRIEAGLGRLRREVAETAGRVDQHLDDHHRAHALWLVLPRRRRRRRRDDLDLDDRKDHR